MTNPALIDEKLNARVEAAKAKMAIDIVRPIILARREVLFDRLASEPSSDEILKLTGAIRELRDILEELKSIERINLRKV